MIFPHVILDIAQVVWYAEYVGALQKAPHFFFVKKP